MRKTTESSVTAAQPSTLTVSSSGPATGGVESPTDKKAPGTTSLALGGAESPTDKKAPGTTSFVS